MKKGIIVPFFEEISFNKRLELMKKAGFSTLMISFDVGHEKFTAPLEQTINLCKQHNLQINTAHAPYKEPDVNNFWLPGEKGEELKREYIKYINLASKHNIKTVVYHLHFMNDYELTDIGINRLNEMVKFAEKHNVNVAIENLYSYKELDYIFSKIKSKNLGFCFDSGHENFLTPKADFLNKHGNKLHALHLHDNDGYTDQHKTPFSGTINWDNIAKGLASANEVNLDSEVKLKRPNNKTKVTEEELLSLLKKEYLALQKLEKIVMSKKEVNLDA
jgi:sugar phosphate isomerase/epimerase